MKSSSFMKIITIFKNKTLIKLVSLAVPIQHKTSIIHRKINTTQQSKQFNILRMMLKSYDKNSLIDKFMT